VVRTFCGAAILVLGSFDFFFVRWWACRADAGRLTSVAIAGMILRLFAVTEYRVLPPVPSIVFNLLVVSTGVGTLAYLLLP